MESVVITGAGGFLGSHLAARLASSGSRVAGVGRRERPADVPLGIEWFVHDLRQPPALLREFLGAFRPSVVYHLAATSFEPQAALQPWSVMQNNLLSTLNMLDACWSLVPPPRCIVVSSSAVYGRQPEEALPLLEDMCLHPLTTYGVSKVAVETLARQHWEAYGRPVIVVRPFNLMGPGEHAVFVTSAFARQVAHIEAGRQPPSIRVGDLTTTRDFTDVRDAADALVGLGTHGEPGAIYNLCSGVGLTIADLVRGLQRVTSGAFAIEPDATLMRAAEIRAQWGDSTKLKRATGWERRHTLDQTLADVLDDWRIRVRESNATNER